MKVKSPSIITTPQKTFDNFSQKITGRIKYNLPIENNEFNGELLDIGRVFEEQNIRPELNKKAQKLAETLVNMGKQNLAGIVYSFLIKINQGNTALIETFAQNGLKIARRLNDDIHIMSRTDDLREVYKRTQFGSDKHLKVLYETKRMLKNIIKNHDTADKKYNTISRKIKPREAYEYKLSSILIEIAGALQRKDPKLALEELTAAKAILAKDPTNPAHVTIQKLESKIAAKQ